MSKKAPSHTRLIIGIGIAWLFDAMDVGMLSFVIAALHKEVQLKWVGSEVLVQSEWQLAPSCLA